ncbi:Sushi domain-containing protein 2 [Holothuria leucospilota]|uniref:Sushi domain-containing protein 2 n=1 Tax=Holothuria leucospilota TaxID=206669 RepID=A0A9Q1BYN1_HOLLE|nr:Sushi domain-containing protein 2 [Holothuria leucospilota]
MAVYFASDQKYRHTVDMFVFILTLLLTICSVQGQVTSNLYPYGPGNSDSTLTNGNDLSASVAATTPINFYAERYNTLFVNTNGIISLGCPLPEPQTNDFFNNFPLYPDLNEDGELEKNVLIAPFWADVDTSNNRGNIYYRQSTESTLLNNVTNDVRNVFILYSDYIATWAFISTWENVSFYNHQESSSLDPRNTFQVVLTTDGLNTFVFFLYDTVEWSAGTTLNGDPETGIPTQNNHQAVIGFNRGDGLNGYEDGFPSNVLNLPTDSNVDASGLYAFKIDSEDILSAGCQDGVTIVYTFPVFGNMFGGERVYLIGPCWGISVGDDLKCRFTSSEGDVLQVANGTVESRQSAYCVPEPFFLVGEVTLEVSINDGNTWNYEGVYRIVYPGRVTSIGRVTRLSSSSSDWETADNALTITWDTAQFEVKDRLDAHVLAYREDGSGPRWEEVYTIVTDVENTGSISFTPTATEMVTKDNAFGLIRVQPTNRGIGRKLYTTEHALGYVLEQEYQNNPEVWSNEKCLAWAAEDDSLPTYTDSLLNCPCTLDQALTDSGRFQPDTGCSMFTGSVCTYHVGAKHCVRSVFASSTHAGTQCCYNGDGYLMYAGDTDQGSTNDRSHVWGSEPYLQADKIPSLSHWKHDVITFYYCCLWGTDCRSYMERRITMDCANYEPAEHAIAFGDPHIITFDDSNYTFNGKGEFTLIEVIQPTRFRLDGRFEVIPAFTSTTEKQDGATGLTALVMFENSSDVIQIDKDALNGMALYTGTQALAEGGTKVANWERISFRDQTWLDLKGVSITINNDMGPNKLVTSLTVMFRSSSIGVNITRLEDNEVLSVSVILPSSLQGTSYIIGIFGSYNNEAGDDLQTKYGGFTDPRLATDEEIYQAGLSWRTPESTLFRYDDKTFYDLLNDTNYNPLLTSPDESSLTPSELSFMETTCGNITQCRFDFLVTRDRGIAIATSSAEEHYQWAEEKMLKMTSCTFIPTPRNGIKIYSQMEDGEVVSSYSNNFVGTVIEFGCDEFYVLEGSPKRVCQDDGTYSGSEVINDCIYSPCGGLPVVENGYMELSELDGYQLVTITCDQGYVLEGPSDRQCNGEDWSGVDSRCVDEATVYTTKFEENISGTGKTILYTTAYEDHPSEKPITDCKRNGLIAASCIEGAIIIILLIVIATLLQKGARKGATERGNKSDEEYNGKSNFGMVPENVDEKYESDKKAYQS